MIMEKDRVLFIMAYNTLHIYWPYYTMGYTGIQE